MFEMTVGDAESCGDVPEGGDGRVGVTGVLEGTEDLGSCVLYLE